MARARTVRVYHDRIKEFVENDQGIADVMETLAERIREVALQNARVIIPNLHDEFLTIESGKDTKGLFFRIQPDSRGKLSAYLSAKEQREHVWFEPAVAEVAGIESLRVNIFA